MSASQRILCTFSSSFSSPSSVSRTFLFLRFPSFHNHHLTLARSIIFASSSFPVSGSIMPNRERRGGNKTRRWVGKSKADRPSVANEGVSTAAVEAVAYGMGGLCVAENTAQAHVPGINFGSVQMGNQTQTNAQREIWMPKSYGTMSGSTSAQPASVVGSETAAVSDKSVELSKLFSGNSLENFTVDNSTYTIGQIRATFYPKFENEKSDQEIRIRMVEMVSKGLATLEVSLKHSGSLFMYAGNKGGAYAKNSFGNIYTAVGVFVLGRMFREAWGSQAAKKQAEFNEFLENNHMCVSMELVTAVLGDHGQRPNDDYVVVTAVTELGKGRPKFYSTPEIIAFCRKWRLPTNHIWLFSTRKSVSSFFAAFDALCEEGTATPVCKTLDEVADISVPGSKDHIKVQGEILEGLVARIVTHESEKHMEEVLREFPPPPVEGASLGLGPGLREICAENRSDEKQQIKALIESVGPSFCPDHSDWFGRAAVDSHSRTVDRAILSKFLQAHPADYSTTKLQEMMRLMRERRFPAAFKCYHNLHKIESISSDNLFYKMVIHVHSDSVFRRYQKEMRQRPGLWPLYRGFFIDINLFKANKERAAEIAKKSNDKMENGNESAGTLGKDSLADDDANLMIKLKFLTYKMRTFLIRNGLSTLFKDGPAAYKAYYLRQMKNWGTSVAKQRQLSKMLDEWAVYIRRKYGNRQLSSATYLSEAEPFLEQYAKRSPENQALVGSAGNLVRAEDFLAIVAEGKDEEGDLEPERDVGQAGLSTSVKDSVPKDQGLIVFFPGIPGCAKSALCKELLNASGGLGNDRPVQSLMGDLVKGRYWKKVAEEWRKKPCSIMLADKNAPNEEVWRQIEDMCRTTRASAVPVVPDSEGTISNPFSLDALAVFMFRVLQRVNHPGNLDQGSPNAGYVLLMFYHLYEGKDRQEFEGELIERFGSLVKMPLLSSERTSIPEPIKTTLEEGINLYKLHTARHGRLDSTKGSYVKEWMKWEKQLRDVLFGNKEYLNFIQVPFESAVSEVLEQLRKIARGEYATPIIGRRKLGGIVFAAVSLPVTDICTLLNNLAGKDSKVKSFFNEKDMQQSLTKAHVTLAHKRSHGVTALASYSVFVNRNVPVELTALLYSDKVAALEARLGSVDGENIESKNEWPHVTIWTGEGVAPKEANALPQMHAEGNAMRVEIDPPATVSGPLRFF